MISDLRTEVGTATHSLRTIKRAQQKVQKTVEASGVHENSRDNVCACVCNVTSAWSN